MNNRTGSESNNSEGSTSNNGVSVDGGSTNGSGESTGLPWPKSWKGAYILVIANFALWLALLLSLQEFCK